MALPASIGWRSDSHQLRQLRHVSRDPAPLSYRRFANAAEAIRFAVEDFLAIQTLGAWMRVGDERFNGDDSD